MTTNPDELTHAFRTSLGLPPDKGTPPVCGAALTDAYDWPSAPRPVCPTCRAAVEAEAR
jgi:hypothetical protein